VVPTATTAVVTAVTTTAVSGSGICISNTGISNFLGGGGASLVEVSAFTPSGDSKSVGGITIVLYLGTFAVGTFKVILGIGGTEGNVNEGSSN
tara:strand:- start:1333 stop:1611 length:279 start_codon:yes stop_codon:yes gene_type:complete